MRLVMGADWAADGVFTLFAILFRLIFLSLKLVVGLIKGIFKALWFILKHLGMGISHFGTKPAL